MSKYLVEHLTLDDIKSILVSRFEVEFKAAEGLSQEFSLALGLPVEHSPQNEFLTRRVMDILCGVVSERIVYDDPSQITFEDFEPRFLSSVVQELGLDEDTMSELMKYIQTMFKVIVKTMGLLDLGAYFGYKSWIQKFLDLAESKNVLPSDLKIDQEVHDSITRMEYSKEVFIERGTKEIDLFASLDGFTENVIKPILQTKLDEFEAPAEEKELIMAETLAMLKETFGEKIEVIRDQLLTRMYVKVERIYG